MAGDDDEFGYSDDDLDALPANALRELESQAILSTQQQRATTTSRHVQQSRQQPPSFRANASRQSRAENRPAAVLEAPSSNYSSFDVDDEDVINLDEEQPVADDRTLTLRHDVPPQPRPLRQENARRNGKSVQGANGQRAMDDDQAQGQKMKRYASGGRQSATAEAVIETMWQDRINQLERQLEALTRQSEEYKQLYHAKAGETVIVRRNLDKASKDNEQKISEMQQAHAEVLAKRNVELEAAKREREKVETNNRFLEHDLAQEAGRTKQARKTLKDATGKSRSVGLAATPKRNKSLPFGDGFDDGDIVMASPSKARERSKASTPKHSGKRKRTAGEPSPGKPLPLTGSFENLQHQDSVDSDRVPNEPTDAFTAFGGDDGKFKFLQRLMNHRPSGASRKTFEAFTIYAFPSAPSRLLSSIIFEEISQYQDDADNLSKRFCQILLSLWERCLQESYFTPLVLIIKVLQYVLAFEPLHVAASLTENLAPLAIPTADLIAIPIGQASTNPEVFKSRKQTSGTASRGEIDVYEIMSLLLTVAHGCISSTDANTHFWRHMKYDFVLLMLMKAQPLPQVILTLRMLCTSATESSFGAIIPDADFNVEQQRRNESAIIDRLTNLLSEKPKAIDAEEPYGSDDVADLRLEVLNVFSAMLAHDYGARSLALHRYAIGRLVRLLDLSISTLYSVSPDTATHSKTVRVINLSMRIVYHLLSKYSDIVDRRAKMSVIPGGNHRHIVALTRLAFSDGLILERGIEEEVSVAAHQLLDEFLSPEEGETLVQVYSSAKSAT